MLSRITVLFALAAMASAESGCEGEACNADADPVIMLQTPDVNIAFKAGVVPPVSLTQTSVEAASAIKLSAAAAEFVAMTLFVIIGCGSAMGSATEPGWVLQVSLTFGLAITALAYTVGHYSGAQINCAVTFGLVVSGNLSAAQGALNFVAQMLGSVVGAFILTKMITEEQDKTGGLGTNGVSEGKSNFNALVGEICMTFLLMFVVMEAAVNPAAKANSAVAPLAIGFAVFLAHSVLIPIDGCSINPTRTFGPAVIRKFMYKSSGTFDDMWVFWAGPLIGAGLAAVVSQYGFFA